MITDRINIDWDSFTELWADVTRFMKENPKYTLICADDPPKLGWVAFDSNQKYEMMKEWTIDIQKLKNEPLNDKISMALKSFNGRQQMCKDVELLRTQAGK